MQQLGDIANAQSEIGGLVAVYANFLLGDAGFEAGQHVGDPRHIRNHLCNACGQGFKRGQFVAADLHGHPFIAAQEPFQQKLALRCAHTDFHTGDAAGQTAAQVSGDLDIGALAPAGRQQRHLDFTLGDRVSSPAGGADADHRCHHLGHGRLNDLLHDSGLPINQLEPRADFHLAGYTNFAFITGRQKFAADQRQQQQTGSEHGSSRKNGNQTVVQSPAQHLQVGILKIRKKRSGSDGPAIYTRSRRRDARTFRTQEPGSQHGHQTQRQCQRTDQCKNDDIGQLFEENARDAAHKNQR